MRYKFLSLALLCYVSTAFAGVWDYNSIMNAVRKRDLALLKKMVAAGYDINTTANGLTPLCETVYLKDYQGYEMLLSQGASVYVPCMRSIPSQNVNDFYANQPRLGTYYQGSMSETLPVQSVQAIPTAQTVAPVQAVTETQISSDGGTSFAGTALYTGEVVLGVAALGGLSLAVGGGGGGGGSGAAEGSDDSAGVKVVWDSPFHPTAADISSYETTEYLAKVSTGVRDENDKLIYTNSFLSPINASAAYARGYTGYKVSRNASGNLTKTGSEAITDKKVNIAILDTGFYTNHSKLKDNLAQSLFGSDGKIDKTVSFIYGACKDSSDTNCWKEVSSSVSGNKTAITIQRGSITRSVFLDAWEEYRYSTTFSMTGDDAYTYDAKNPAPAPDIEMLMSGSNQYGFLLADGSEKFLRWSKYLYQRPATPVSYNIEDLALSWTWYPYDYDNADNPSIGRTVYYCNKAQSLCVTKTSTGNYTFVEDATLTKLKSLGIFELNYNSEMQHGNTTAGFAIGKKNNHLFHGVAYNAAWIPIAIDLTTYEILQHIPDAINLGADIINISLGPGGVNTSSKSLATYLSNELNGGSAGELWRKGYQAAAKNNTILVFAAGNDGNKYESSYYAAAPALKEFTSDKYDLTNLVVAVVSVDASNKISSFSQICGANKNWCVAAPGELLVSAGEATESMDSYRFGSGTSASAPIVSGALAVIKSAFPHLTNQQVVQILFETATDLGEKGVDKIYGHGLVNLDAATKPVGQTTVALSSTASGSVISAASSSASLPSVLQGVAQNLPKTMTVLDKYQRGFSMPTSAFIKTVKHENQLENRFRSLMAGDERQVVTTDHFSMTWSDGHEFHRSAEMAYDFIDMQVRLSDGLNFGAFYNENTATNGGTYWGRTLNNPFTRMKETWGISGSYEFAKNWRLNTMWATGKNAFVDEDDWDDMDANRVNAFQAGLAWSGVKNTDFKLVSGMAEERASVLGLWGTGAFKSGNTRTTFFGVGAAWHLNDKFQLEGMYYYGMSQVAKQNALIKLSDITAESFAFNAIYTPDEKHSYGFALISPMRIRSGTATIDWPVARDAYEDVMYRSVVHAGLKPSAREYDLSSYYSNRLTDAISLQSEFGVRFNPDHQSGAAPDYRGLISVKIEL